MKPEPNVHDAVVYVTLKLAEWGCYGVIIYCICHAWTITPS